MTKIDDAIAFAAKAHDGQYRKATHIPYITHPFSVAIILMEAHCSEDMVVAGILHDVVEDTEVTLDELKIQFGQEIADIVAGCSEPDKSLSWEERKKHTINDLKTAPTDIKIVAGADKLHNVRSILEDYKRLGEGIWDCFNKGVDHQAWYYREIVKSLYEGLSPDTLGIEIIDQLQIAVKELFNID